MSPSGRRRPTAYEGSASSRTRVRPAPEAGLHSSCNGHEPLALRQTACPTQKRGLHGLRASNAAGDTCRWPCVATPVVWGWHSSSSSVLI